jgi:hypothetical protein
MLIPLFSLIIETNKAKKKSLTDKKSCRYELNCVYPFVTFNVLMMSIAMQKGIVIQLSHNPFDAYMDSLYKVVSYPWCESRLKWSLKSESVLEPVAFKWKAQTEFKRVWFTNDHKFNSNELFKNLLESVGGPTSRVLRVTATVAIVNRVFKNEMNSNITSDNRQ